MRKVIVFCPKFMGYDTVLVEHLKTKYDVIHFDTDLVLYPARQEYDELSKLIKGLFKLVPFFREKYREKLLCKYADNLCEVSDVNDFVNVNYMLVINGDGIPEKYYENLLKKISCPKVLFIWDDFEWLFKKSHIKHFDTMISYNIIDCKKYGFDYLPVFTTDFLDADSARKKYDIAIISSANKDRVAIAKRLYNKYKDVYSFFIYFYDKNSLFNFFSHSSPLPYESYKSILAESRSILDCGRNKQVGPTTRVYDAITTKTKVITTNKHIIEFPVYGSNILVLNKNFDIPSSFIKSPYVDEGITPYPIQRWINEMEGML